MFYRWHIDLAGPFVESTVGGYTNVLICIEAYSKIQELVPLKSKTPEEVARGFTDVVLCRYGASAEVVSDRGSEFEGAMSELLVNCMILHRPTAANHPQANGAAERAVQSAKRGVEKMCEERKSVGDWPDHLPWIRMGYNCSKQASTKLAPYTLLYGLGPTIPPAQKEKMDVPLNLDDPEAAATELLQRQQIIREDMVIAGENLLIAAARQTEQYATKMSGEKLPKVKVFKEGDYVYLRPTSTRCEHITGSGLAINIEPRVLRVYKVRDDGAIELIGVTATG
jgi:hypothetical protein